MRTEKELWEVVLSRPDLFKGGLCTWITDVRSFSLITIEEWSHLINVIYSKRTSEDLYWIGPIYEIQPRIDWIKKRIETL